MKIFNVITLIFIFNILIAQDEKFDITKHPVVWEGESLANSICCVYPFQDKTTFSSAAIYFERNKNSKYIIMRYRVTSLFSYEELYMKDKPTMLVKLGDGTILEGKKERVTDGILNGQFLIDVYFNLDSELQQKILQHGIEKVRIAYVWVYLGFNKTRIYNAYSKDCIVDGLNAEMLLKQIIDADINSVENKDPLKSNF